MCVMFMYDRTLNKVKSYVESLGRVIATAFRDGFCFFRALASALQHDYKLDMTYDGLINKIREEIKSNVDYYSQWHAHALNCDHTNAQTVMINEIEDYLQQGNYHVNAANICVAAACNCINVQLVIVQQHFVGTIRTISHPPGK